MKPVLLLGLLACFSLGCKKASVLNPANNCDKKAEDYSNAISVFVSAQTQANCETVKTTLEAAVKGCTIGLGVDASTYEDLDCSQF
ncbi:hypothetical protein [uncultured Arcticibacterium sp.]|uniref:hypothetical protein n=1 Tax=uncultured Arcticibacterium sp. TaxID=2173042 RepID=UPI0030F5D415